MVHLMQKQELSHKVMKLLNCITFHMHMQTHAFELHILADELSSLKLVTCYKILKDVKCMSGLCPVVCDNSRGQLLCVLTAV